MNWIVNRVRLNRERYHQQKVRKLQQEQWNRIHVIESKYKELDFFAVPESEEEAGANGVISEAREKYALYLLHRVGIQFIPTEALSLARKQGPALAAERVCLWLGLDYHKIATVAPRVASETVRATKYFKEMHDSCDAVGINADALLPHIHFGSHDTRDILFEGFRIAARIIELYDGLGSSIQEHVDWKTNRPIFIDEWNHISSECLMRYYNQGILLSEYQRQIEVNSSLLNGCSQQDPLLFETWLSGEVADQWQNHFPVFEIVLIQVHLSNRVREVNYRRSREWNRILKTIVETDFDFQVLTTANENRAEKSEPETSHIGLN